MKNKLHILVWITALTVLPLLAGDTETKPASVEQRLRDIDVSLALRQYERLKMEAFETKLKLDLLVTDEELTESARKKRADLLERRYDILQMRAFQLSDDARKLGAETAIAKAK